MDAIPQNLSATDSKPLWRPSNPESTTSTFKFIKHLNQKYPSQNLSSYEDLWGFSISDISTFWDEVWEYTDVLGVKGLGASVDPKATPASNPAWYPTSSLNWAENMLRRRDDKVALIQATEAYPHPSYRKITYKELYDLTARVAGALQKEGGVKPGDRVASYSSNSIENVAACLAATALGAIWVSVSADFGADAALSRFQQVQPSVIFSVDQTVYNAKTHDHLPKLKCLINDLGTSPKVVVVSSLGADCTKNAEWDERWSTWDEFISGEVGKGEEIPWCRKPFDWPLWILFSSGTTNKPKPIVHRAGGMLLQSKKEFVICADMTEEDLFFYYTTTGWMMWNFLVNGLSTGCTLVLYDGSPLKDPALLWRLSEDVGVTVFGTSAKYLDQLSRSYKPREHHNLSSIRQIYSTGSPLASHLFDYVYQDISPNVMLSSITGGTDICSLFAGMCTALPVYRGELQCRMLGMAIDSFTSDGRPTKAGESGELVCTKPFPCQPVGFWPLEGFGNLEDVAAAQERYRQSYFDEFPDVWYHGDHVLITPSREGSGGGVIMLGRSDGVLNPGGVRFGSSEIYNVLDAFGNERIVDSLVVGQATQGGADERVVLFLKLPEGQRLDEGLVKEVKTEIRKRRTARHVPEKVLQVVDIPYTLNAKKVEVPVKKLLNGAKLDTLNISTLRNPECMVEYARLGEELRRELALT